MNTPSLDRSPPSTTQRLRAQIRDLESAQHLEAPTLRYVPTPFESFNALLPGSGLPAGALTEILSGGCGHGALEVAVCLASGALRERSVWMLIEDASSEAAFFPHAAFDSVRIVESNGSHAGGSAEKLLKPPPLDRLIRIRASGRRSAWAFIQSLRCPDVSVVVYATASLDNLQQRRFQLAAARGGSLGIVLRPLKALHRACWATLRLKVEPLPGADTSLRERHFNIEILKGGLQGAAARAAASKAARGILDNKAAHGAQPAGAEFE